MRNNNKKVIRKLSDRSLKKNRMSNIFVLTAIVLTSLLFTTLFSLGAGLIQVTEEQTMRQIGTRGHAGLKNVTWDQYEKITANPTVKEHSYNIFLGTATNPELTKRSTEIRYTEAKDLGYGFVSLKEGRLPEQEDEILVDTVVMDLLGVPHELGAKITLSYSFLDKTIVDTFTVCGWYVTDMIAGASEAYISRDYLDTISQGYTEEDFVKGYEENRIGAGLIQGTMMFANSRNIEEKVRTIIAESGFSPEEIEYGINWAYLSEAGKDLDVFSSVIVVVAFLVIMLTGYLIIYNIFRISIAGDIRFYGLLKTIGATKKQIKALVMRQAVLLSVIGIPIGLMIGYGIGNLSIPFLLSVMESTSTTDFHLSANPYIFVLSALFTLVTIYISCRRPGKIAGSVSPIEAAKYSETNTMKEKKKHTIHGARIYAMAFSNLKRGGRRTVITILSLSLSIVLLTEVITFTKSFSMDKYLEAMLTGDFMISSISLTNYNVDYDMTLPEDYYLAVSNQEGIEKSARMYTTKKTVDHVLTDAAKKKFQEFYEQGYIETFAGKPYSREEMVQKVIRDNEPIGETRYSFDESLLEKLKVVDGTFDLEKFKSGDYVLLVRSSDWKESYYKPGDEIALRYHTTDSKEVMNYYNNQQTGRYLWTNDRTKEYQVMAVVELPTGMTTRRFDFDRFTTILPLGEFLKQQGEDSYCFSASFWVADDKEDAFLNYLKDYSTKIDPNTDYDSKETLRQELTSMTRAISIVGRVLSFIIGLIGLLNFINTILTSVITRKRELTMLQSIGLTNRQLRQMLVYEGSYYILLTAVISFLGGSALSLSVIKALGNVVAYFNYQFTILPYVTVLPIFFVLGILVPGIAYKKVNKLSIVERLRDTE